MCVLARVCWSPFEGEGWAVLDPRVRMPAQGLRRDSECVFFHALGLTLLL